MMDIPPVEPTQCMALAIYREARGESLSGQAAVGHVILSRKDHHRFPNTICEVVFQGCQFSWVCQMDDYSPKNRELTRKMMRVAEGVLNGTIENPVPGALFFKRIDSRDWHYPFLKNIGDHDFYGLK